MEILKSRFHLILIIGLIINIFFVLLPTYDTSNLSVWTELALSFHSSFPVFLHNPSPEGAYSILFLIPMQLSYAMSLNLTVASQALKGMIFVFTFLLLWVSLKILEKHNSSDRKKEILALLILFNPAIIFINYVWAEPDILTSFFTILSLYFFREKPLKRYFGNITFGSLSLSIGALLFFFPILLIPSIIYNTSKEDHRILVMVTIVLTMLCSFIFQFFLINGGVYDYFGAFSGTSSVLSPGGLRTGLFYFLSINDVTKTVILSGLLVLIAVFIPIVMRHYRVSELHVDFVIIALLLFISPVINLDNFMFLVPFVFLGILTEHAEPSLRKLILMNLIMIIPLVFAPLLYQHNAVQGLFYWFYPLLHMTGVQFNSAMIANVFFPVYNYTFLILLFLTLYTAVKLPRDTRHFQANEASIVATFKYFDESFKKIVAVCIVLIVISLPFAYEYNAWDNGVNINEPSSFPLYYFYPESYVNSSILLPIGSSYYTISNDALLISSDEGPTLLYKNLSSQVFSMSSTIHLNQSQMNNDVFVKTNSWSIESLNVINISSFQGVKSFAASSLDFKSVEVPLLSKDIIAGNYTGNSLTTYNISLTHNNTEEYAIYFDPSKIGSYQSDVISMDIQGVIIEVALYSNVGYIARYTTSNGWVQSSAIPYTLYPGGGWNSVTFFFKSNSLLINFDNTEFNTSLPSATKFASINVGNPFGLVNYQYFGLISELYRINGPVLNYSSGYYLSSQGEFIPVTLNSTININFSNSQYSSALTINGKTYNLSISNYILIGSAFMGRDVTIIINKLSFNNLISGYYMIIAFYAFYIPVAITSFAVIVTTKFHHREPLQRSRHERK